MIPDPASYSAEQSLMGFQRMRLRSADREAQHLAAQNLQE